MNYTEFYNMFKGYFTNAQIAKIQRSAFDNFEHAHGYKPIRKSEKILLTVLSATFFIMKILVFVLTTSKHLEYLNIRRSNF